METGLKSTANTLCPCSPLKRDTFVTVNDRLMNEQVGLSWISCSSSICRIMRTVRAVERVSFAQRSERSHGAFIVRCSSEAAQSSNAQYDVLIATSHAASQFYASHYYYQDFFIVGVICWVSGHWTHLNTMQNLGRRSSKQTTKHWTYEEYTICTLCNVCTG